MSFDLHPINILNREGAPDFVTVEAKELLDLAVAHFETETGRTLSGSQAEMYLLETISYMLSIRATEEQLAFENNFVAYARPAFLDKHGAGRDTERLQATAAHTALRFYSDTPAVTRIRIPAGTRAGDANGVVQFAIQDVAYLEIGQTFIEVPARALEVGAAANGFAAGTIATLIDTVPGISGVENITESGGGANIEDDGRYRARIALASERISRGGAKQSYEALTLGWNTRVIDVEVIRPEAGHIHIYPLMDTGAVNDTEKADLLKYLEGKIPQGDYVTVHEPVAHDFTPKLHLIVSHAGAVETATRAVQSILDTWRGQLGGYIAPSELIRAAKAMVGVVEADILDLNLVAVAPNAWRNAADLIITVEVRS